MTFQELSKANLERSLKDYNTNPIEYGNHRWLICLTEEFSELAQLLTRQYRKGIDPHPNDLMTEIGDVCIVLDLLCSANGISLEDCIKLAFNNKSAKIGSEITI